MSFDPMQILVGIEAGARRQREAARDAVGQYAEQILADSQELVPVSPTDPKHPNYIGTSGALQDSGTVGDVDDNGGNWIDVEIGYNTDYAAAVHERLDANHKYPGRVKPKAQAKYLSQPMQARKDGFGPFVAEVVKEATDG